MLALSAGHSILHTMIFHDRSYVRTHVHVHKHRAALCGPTRVPSLSTSSLVLPLLSSAESIFKLWEKPNHKLVLNGIRTNGLVSCQGTEICPMLLSFRRFEALFRSREQTKIIVREYRV